MNINLNGGQLLGLVLLCLLIGILSVAGIAIISVRHQEPTPPITATHLPYCSVVSSSVCEKNLQGGDFPLVAVQNCKVNWNNASSQQEFSSNDHISPCSIIVKPPATWLLIPDVDPQIETWSCPMQEYAIDIYKQTGLSHFEGKYVTLESQKKPYPDCTLQ